MVEESGRPIVLITGISGFVGSTVALKILKTKPEWKIRGLMRHPDDACKLIGLKKAWGDKFDDVELVRGDVFGAETLIQATKGVTYVVHCAMLVPSKWGDSNPERVKRTAIDGTLNLLRACKENRVKRVTMTGSMLSVMDSWESQVPEIYTEEDWSVVTNATPPYPKSKTCAEKHAWAYINAMAEEERIEFTTLLPGYLFGPTCIAKGFGSGNFLEGFFDGTFKKVGVPRLHIPVADVRDCAIAHIRCLERDEAQGKRFIISSDVKWFREIGQSLDWKYGPLGYNCIATKESKYCWLKLLSYSNDEAAAMTKYWGVDLAFDNTRAKEILGVDFRPFQESLYEMADALIENEHIAPPSNPPVAVDPPAPV